MALTKPVVSMVTSCAMSPSWRKTRSIDVSDEFSWPLLSVSATQIQRLLPELDRHSVEGVQQHVDETAANGTASKDEGFGASAANADSTGTDSRRPTDAPSHSDFHWSKEVSLGERGALARFAIDLTEKAHRGEIDPVFGRDREIQQMIDVLARRRKNNPILVGEPGVGKTALVEGLALRVAEGNVPDVICDVRILTLDLGLLQAGAGVKGEFEQRL